MVAESNGYQQEVVERKDVIKEDSQKRLEEFKQHLAESPLDEQIRIAKDWDERVNKYMDPELKAATTVDAVENVENSEYVKESSTENVKKVANLMDAINNYPDVPEAQKKATEEVIYGMVDNSAEDVAKALNSNKIKDKSDYNIEE